MEDNKNIRDIKKVMKKKKVMMKAVPLINNSKRPAVSWKDNKEHIDFHLYSFKKYKEEGNSKNYSILTGKINDLSIVDIDFPKDWTEEQKKQHPFILAFGDDPNEWGCPVIQTRSGGYHLYYKYDDRIMTVASRTQQDGVNNYTDTRGNGGLIVAPYSEIDGGKYTPLIGNPENRPPLSDEIFRFLDGCGLISGARKITKQKIENFEYEEINDCDQSLYKYDIPDNMLLGLIAGLPKSYFEDYHAYLLFTTAMKQINRRDIFIKFPKTSAPVDDDINSIGHQKWCIKMYDNIKEEALQNLFAIENLCKNSSYNMADQICAYYKYKPLLSNDRIPDEEIQRTKLGYDAFKSFIEKYPDKKYFVYKSGTGTGKTTSFIHYIQQTQMKFISIVSRVSLGKEQYNVFNRDKIDTAFYQMDEYNRDDNYIVQIDSLLKLYYEKDFIGDYCLFLDEYNSIIKHLITSSTLDKNGIRIPIMELFTELIKNATYVFMTDADISDASLELFSNDIGLNPESLLYIKNTHQPNKGTTAREIYDFETIMELLLDTEDFICPCDEARVTELVYNKIIQKYGIDDPETLLVNARTQMTGKNWDDYKRIIFSPSVIYGLDSLRKRPVIAIYKENTIDAGDMLQQINRNRNISILYYFFGKKKSTSAHYNTLEEFIKETDNIEKASRTNNYLAMDLNRKGVSPIFKNIYNKIKYNEDCYGTNQFAHARKLMEDRGFIMNSSVRPTDKKIMNKKLKIDKERRIEEIHKNLPEVIKKNKILQIPEEEIENFKPIFIQTDFIEKYLTISNTIFNNHDEYYDPDTQELQKYYEAEAYDEVIEDDTIKRKKKLDKKQEFYIKKIKTTANKIIFIDDLRKAIGVKHRLKIENVKVPNKTIANKLWNDYQIIFNNKTENTKNPFLVKEGIQKYINKMYIHIYGPCGAFPTSSTSKDGKTITKYMDAKPDDFGDYYKVYVLSQKNKGGGNLVKPLML
tara:strand:+ start:2184 stop:5105 length:2922 start_codon:yes stop_codon:yes gene_type:complete